MYFDKITPKKYSVIMWFWILCLILINYKLGFDLFSGLAIGFNIGLWLGFTLRWVFVK